MSDLEKRIEQWRADLSSSETLGAGDIGELESHLREEISHLQATGLSDVEAFLVARHRLGDAATLEREFAKINARVRLASRLRWLAAGAMLYILLTQLGSIASFAFVWLGFDRGLTNVATLAVVGGLVWIVAAAAAVLFASWLYARVWAPRTARSISKMMAVFASVAVVLATVALYALQTLSTTLAARSLGAQAFASIAIARSCAGIPWMVLIPILLMGWLAARHLRNNPKANVHG